MATTPTAQTAQGAPEVTAGDAGEISPAMDAAFVDLPSGAALEVSECGQVMRERHTQLIVLAGSEESGKTTLVASIYESLQERPFADLQFAGSGTLIGFEQICHLNRVSSGQPTPATERTKPTEQAVFYHLALVDTAKDANLGRREVLLSSVSGELYRLARNSSEGSTALRFLKRADVLAILIDGARLSEIQSRERALSDAQQLLRSLLDAGMVPTHARVEFLVSKYDCVLSAGDEAERFVRGAQGRLLSAFGERVAGIECRHIAARPIGDALPFAFGVDGALRAWLATPPRQPAPSSWAIDPGTAQREFARFGSRYRCHAGKVP